MFNSRNFFAVVDQLVQFFNCIISFIKKTFISVKKYIFRKDEITKTLEYNKNINQKSNIISHVEKEDISSYVNIKDISDSFHEKHVLFVNLDDLELSGNPYYEKRLMHLVMKFMANWRCENLFEKKLYISVKVIYYDTEDKSKNIKDKILTSSTIKVTSSIDNKIYVYEVFNDLYLSLKSREEACSVEIITVGCSAERLKKC
jgi:hypothetical protein